MCSFFVGCNPTLVSKVGKRVNASGFPHPSKINGWHPKMKVWKEIWGVLENSKRGSWWGHLGWGPLNNQPHIHLISRGYLLGPISPFKGLQQGGEIARGPHPKGTTIFPTWRIIPVSKWLGSPPFISHKNAIWKGNKGSHNPILSGLTITMVINHVS